MIAIPVFIGLRIDVEDPPYEHQGEGMTCVLWAVHDRNGVIVCESTEGMGFVFGPESRVTVLDPEYQADEMSWRRNFDAEYAAERAARRAKAERVNLVLSDPPKRLGRLGGF